MKNITNFLTIHCQINPKWLRGIIVFCLAIGIFFRFANLEQKIYWGDEAYTSLWISGHTSTELISSLFTGEIIQVEDFQKYQGIFPGNNVIDTVNALAKDTPLMPPLYFALVRCWVGVFGDSIATIRAFSAVVSLFVFPAIYWLCWELFNSSLVGWIAIAITAVCPYQVLYAQEARPYILWAVTILLSSACLLRAIRINKPLNWGIYAIALTASLYTHLFSVFVAVGQGIYLLIIERFRLNKILINYLLSSLAAFLLFFPWFLCIIKFQEYYPDQRGSSIFTIAKRLIGILPRIILDFGPGYSDSVMKISVMLILNSLVLAFICYACWVTIRKNPLKISAFLVIFTWFILMVTVFRDLITTSGVLLTNKRYLFPVVLGIEISIADFLSYQISQKKIPQRLCHIILLGLISSGILSGAISLPAKTWWNKEVGNEYTEIVEQINQYQNPVVISDTKLWGIWNLIYYHNLDKSKLKLQLFTPKTLQMFNPEKADPNISDASTVNYGNSDLLLFYPSPGLLDKFEASINGDLVTINNLRLWQIK
jgi:uncharacterized membrane protein